MHLEKTIIALIRSTKSTVSSLDIGLYTEYYTLTQIPYTETPPPLPPHAGKHFHDSHKEEL